MNNITNPVSYLRTSREFPKDAGELSSELSKAYIDIANTVNTRTIGIFPVNRAAITGESWFISNNLRQQTFRQVYNITSYAAIAHGINISTISTFTRIYGIGYDGTNYFTLPMVDPNPAGQVALIVTPTQIVMIPGGLAPAIQRGVIILEWLSQP